MPVNMDPNKRKRKQTTGQDSDVQEPAPPAPDAGQTKFGEETERDREKASADAEWKNLWDATEVIDMDTW